MHATDDTTPAVSQTWYIPQLTNSIERRIKLDCKCSNLHTIVNNKIENTIWKHTSKNPVQNQNKDNFTNFPFYCRTIKDWNKLQENITNNNTKMPLWDATLSDTF